MNATEKQKKDLTKAIAIAFWQRVEALCDKREFDLADEDTRDLLRDINRLGDALHNIEYAYDIMRDAGLPKTFAEVEKARLAKDKEEIERGLAIEREAREQSSEENQTGE